MASRMEERERIERGKGSTGRRRRRVMKCAEESLKSRRGVRVLGLLKGFSFLLDFHFSLFGGDYGRSFFFIESAI